MRELRRAARHRDRPDHPRPRRRRRDRRPRGRHVRGRKVEEAPAATTIRAPAASRTRSACSGATPRLGEPGSRACRRSRGGVPRSSQAPSACPSQPAAPARRALPSELPPPAPVRGQSTRSACFHPDGRREVSSEPVRPRRLLEVECTASSTSGRRPPHAAAARRARRRRRLLQIGRGETLGLVGESGCGKSTLATLHRPPDRADRGRDPASRATTSRICAARRCGRCAARVQMVFQDPYSSLNPRMTVGEIVGEPLHIHEARAPGASGSSACPSSSTGSG